MRILLSVSVSVFSLFITLIANASENYGSKICGKHDNLSCYTVKRHDSWEKLFKDPSDRDLAKRINRMNTRLHSGMQIAIPIITKDSTLLDFSPFPTKIEAPGEKIILVSLSRLAFGAYSLDGTLEYWGPVSGGRDYCPDLRHACHSPLGQFEIYSKQGSDCVSTKFPIGRGGAPMPYCMFFHNGFALHGSYEVPGYNASHGCIRMFVDDAEWLNQEFTSDESNVPVIIED